MYLTHQFVRLELSHAVKDILLIIRGPLYEINTFSFQTFTVVRSDDSLQKQLIINVIKYKFQSN